MPNDGSWLLVNPPAQPLGRVHIAIAIKRYAPGRYHTGVVYRGPANELFLIHLREHLDLHDGPFHGNYALAIPRGLIESEANVVAAHCRLIAKKSRVHQIPYGLRYSGAYFAANGTFENNGNVGLTCATFVLAVFKSFNVELLERDGWLSRPELENQLRDLTLEQLRQRIPDDLAAILEDMEQLIDVEAWKPGEIGDDSEMPQGRAATPEDIRRHIERISAETDWVRFKPTEVAGSASAKHLPIGFTDAQVAAKYIEERLG